MESSRRITAKGVWNKTGTFILRLPGWSVPVCISALIVIASIFYLLPSPVEFPMDDSYIHFVYAGNLVDHGRLFFNSPGEKGVASTSIMWVGLLAAGYSIGIPFHLTAKILGVLSLILTSLGVYQMLRPAWNPTRAGAAALLLSLSGNMLWFSLNGMETMLFLALGIWTLLLYREEKWGWFGLLFGLSILTRPEGLLIAAASGLMELLSHRRLRRGFILSMTLGLLICSPWFGYLKLRTGEFLPTSASAKQFTATIALDYLLKKYNLPPVLGGLSWIVYPVLWIVYPVEFGLGGMALPPPKLNLPGIVNGLNTELSFWVFPAVAIVIWLMYLAGKRFFRIPHWKVWIGDRSRRIILLLFVWVVLHNLAYMFMLPTPGTASRYGALNYILLWIAVVAGLSKLEGVFSRRLFVGACLATIAFANGLYWNRVYDANIEHMLNVRIAAAHYIRDEFNVTDKCAVFDIGALRYHLGRPIVDIASLVEKSGRTFFRNGVVDEFIVTQGANCLVLPGQTGKASDGALDFALIMGLTSSRLFDMELVKIFEIDPDRWLLGYLPTLNYQASVTIYRLKMK